MKKFITRKTSFITTAGIAAGLGFVSLWAQDEPRRDTEKDRQTERKETTKSLEDAQEQTFRGKLVSLTAYMSKDDHSAADKARKSARDATDAPNQEREDTAAANRPGGTENQPLALIITEGAGQVGTTDRESTRTEATPGAPQRPSVSGTHQDHKVCVLLFEPKNQHLAAKAQAICKLNEQKTVGQTAATAKDDDSETKADQTAHDKKDMEKVSITGKKVMRGGLTAIFVENIESSDLSALNR